MSLIAVLSIFVLAHGYVAYRRRRARLQQLFKPRPTSLKKRVSHD